MRLKNARTNIFLNLVQLRITREASSRIYVILLLHFWFVLVFKFLNTYHSKCMRYWGIFIVLFFKIRKFRKTENSKIRTSRNARETANSTRVWCFKTVPLFRTIYALHYRSFIFCEPWGKKMSIEPRNLSAGRGPFSVKTLEKRLGETAENGYGLSDLPYCLELYVP